MVAEDVEWAGAGTKLRSFRYTYSGADDRVAPAFLDKTREQEKTEE